MLVRRYVYDERYQQLIEGRKIKDQTVFLRQAEAKAAIEQRKRDTIVAEGKANQEIELSRGRAEVEKLRAQADLYRRKRAAEGKLLVELAEAKGTQLENSRAAGRGQREPGRPQDGRRAARACSVHGAAHRRQGRHQPARPRRACCESSRSNEAPMQH